MPGAFAVSGSMACRPRKPRSNPLKLSTVPLDRLVQFLVIAVFHQVGRRKQGGERSFWMGQSDEESSGGRNPVRIPFDPSKNTRHAPQKVTRRTRGRVVSAHALVVRWL